MSSAVSFNVNKSQILSFGNELKDLHTANCRKELKTLWEKEKMLVISIFFFSHNVFNKMKMVKSSPKWVENTGGKGEIAQKTCTADM